MYTYGELMDDIDYLGYNGAEIGCIGKSVWDNAIPYVHIGAKGKNQAIITGAIHARENITALLAIRQAYRYLKKQLSIGIYFVPMINVDGAILLEKGAPNDENGDFLRKINGGDDFSLWKANAKAVDLNVNFDAGFGTGKQNVFAPSSENYVGKAPFDQPETQALRDFTNKVKPFFTLSYHALGREVYWQYHNRHAERDRRLAQKIADHTGYRLVDGDGGSAGGYKDWCVLQGISAVTVEIISSVHTHPIQDAWLKEEWEQNKDIPRVIEGLAQLL